MAPTDNSSPWDWAAAAVHHGSTKPTFPQVRKTPPPLNWALTPTDFILTQHKAQAQELGNKHRALPQELSMFNMENYRTSTRLFYFAQLHIFQEEHRGSDRLPGSRFVHTQHGGWTAGSTTVIQEPLALRLWEQMDNHAPPSLQLTEELVSNLERKRGLSNSWFRDGKQQGVIGPPTHTAPQPWLLS